MIPLRFLLQCFLPLFIFLVLSAIISAKPFKVDRLNRMGIKFTGQDSDSPSASTMYQNDFKTYFYEQTLDHFNYGPQSYAIFKQKYAINSKYWGGANSSSPIFAYLGEEQSLKISPDFLSENAPRFKALLVYIEHRFYGESNPLGSMEKSLKNISIRGYFSSAQAIADYAEILLHVREKFSSPTSPIVVFGGSYGGMLAAWFRLKYPHIAIGALASSAPILYFDNIIPNQNGYFAIVARDFKEASKSCHDSIRKSWYIIDEIASKPDGLSILSQKFKTCTRLDDSSELKKYLGSIYVIAAQYDYPPVSMICRAIDGASKAKRADVLGQIFAGVVAARGNASCYNTKIFQVKSETDLGWSWQTCSEMVMPIGISNDNTMFPSAPFNLMEFIEQCKNYYGVPPRPHWVTTYYGGHDIKLVLRKFGSNIIFSNGLKDPYSGAGVLEDLSDSLLAVSTANGTHCRDILPSREDDPQWLVMQRNIEVQIIAGWIANYYADLLHSRNGEKFN